jgi:hypothetical protein
LVLFAMENDGIRGSHWVLSGTELVGVWLWYE